jgi:tetratricopeptide (TPR) repeat protein
VRIKVNHIVVRLLGGTMDEIVNPYIAGAPVTEQRMFFGREDIFQWIENSITGQYADHILVVHGQRRVGKTSVLKQLGNRLPKRFIPVFFDLQGRTHTTLDRFLWWLAREIVRVLKQERGIEIPLPEKDAFSADLEYFENQFLSGLHSSLAGNTLLLTFDEFDNLEESEIKEILGRPLIDYLRRMMGNQDLNFIFSIGSSGRKLENMQASYTDFFKTALYKKISFLNEEQTHKLITQPVVGIIKYDGPATNRIFRIAGGHPYFTQLTCHELFARCQRTDQRHIRETDVEAILEDVVERGTVNLKFVWDEASDIEKWALASLASLDKPDNRTLAAYLRKQNVRFSESDLTSGLLRLREKDVLTSENHFVIHLLKMWMQKNRPIEQVREELTEVNPIANRYIEIGLEFKNSRQYEKAIESFQQALAISAGNIQAQVSIALVYMDQKAFDKAVGEFEKALAIDDEDVTARSGLCEAHLALGDSAMQKGRWKEAAQSYQRVLAINDEHTEARQRMAEIHRLRAEKALVEGRDEDALNAFADAMKYAPEDETLSARVEAVRAEKKARVIATQIARSEKEASAKNWEAAIRTLEEAKSLAPDDSNIQKRLTDAREKLRESKLAVLRTKAQSAAKAGKFNEALKVWQEYLSLEPHDREKAEEEISQLKKLVELEEVYNEAQQAITNKGYDKAINLLKQVIVQDENFKDTSRLLTQAIELRRSSRPARITLPVAKILKGLLIVIGIAGLGIGAYFSWNQWGKNITILNTSGTPSITRTPVTTLVITESQVAVTQPTLDPAIQIAATQLTLDPAIQTALDTIQKEVPTYQINFDLPWFKEFYNNQDAGTSIANEKLILTGETQKENRGYLILPPAIQVSDMFAVEFEFRILESTPGGRCRLGNWSESGGMGISFSPQGQVDLWMSGLEGANSNFDVSKTNTFTLISFGEQITVLNNGQFAATISKPRGTNIYGEMFFNTTDVIVCEFDNYKIWDLSGVDFTSSSAASLTQVAVTPTRTPRPISTGTPPPAWVTEFAEPILATIAGQPPHVEDDIETATNSWLTQKDDCASGSRRFERVDGELVVSKCSFSWKMWYTDFVIEMDYRFLAVSGSNNDDRWTFTFRGTESFSFPDSGEVFLRTNQNVVGLPYTLRPDNLPKHVLIIVKDQAVALFINDEPVYYGKLPAGFKNGEANWFSYGPTMAYDNFKIWNINDLP